MLTGKNVIIKRGQFIVFSGIDGAGKSTQLELLINYFKINNIRYYKFWSRGGYTPGFQFVKDILRFVFRSRLPKSGNSPKRDKALKKSLVRKLWIIFSITDLFIFYAIWLRIINVLGYNIICDRYIFDTKIDFQLNFPDESIADWKLWKLLNSVVPVPSQNFLFLIPINESVKRSKKKFEPFPDSVDRLKSRAAFYKKELHKGEHVFINGLLDVYEVHRLILSYVLRNNE